MWENGGATTTRFFDFIQRILNDIGPGTPKRRKFFTMDNLSVHRNLLVQQIIYNAGHHVVFRALYHTVNKLIEYYFNHIQMSLILAMYQLESLAGLQLEVRTVLRDSHTFQLYFIYCGFANN